MSAPTVWVTQKALRRRRKIGGKLVETEIDVSGAQRFGLLRYLLHASLDLNTEVAAAMALVRTRLRDAREGDYILPLGSPSVIGMTTALLAERLTKFYMLYWDREAGEYLPVEMNFQKGADT